MGRDRAAHDLFDLVLAEWESWAAERIHQLCDIAGSCSPVRLSLGGSEGTAGFFGKHFAFPPHMHCAHPHGNSAHPTPPKPWLQRAFRMITVEGKYLLRNQLSTEAKTNLGF